MKRMLLCALLMVFASSLPTSAARNEPKGFRGIMWGDQLNDHYSEMKDADISGMCGVRAFEKREEQYTLGQAKIFKVYYFFDGTGFLFAVVLAQGIDNGGHLMEACIENWGLPTTLHEKVNLYWE